jgi:hypothetical protein
MMDMRGQTVWREDMPHLFGQRLAVAQRVNIVPTASPAARRRSTKGTRGHASAQCAATFAGCFSETSLPSEDVRYYINLAAGR